MREGAAAQHNDLWRVTDVPHPQSTTGNYLVACIQVLKASCRKKAQNPFVQQLIALF
jgi:hypothetical protein